LTRVKICGITNLADARAAVAAGADAIGFIFAESPRRVSPEEVRDILQALDLGHAVGVGVFVDEPPERVMEIAKVAGLKVLQLHGGEPPEAVEQLCSSGFDIVKSFRVSAEKSDLSALGDYHPTAFLLDTYARGRPGGTGETFDWRLAVEARQFGRVILAGGLGVDNVLEAIAVASPYGVDASSRLEVRPGVKDHELVRKFVRLVKSQIPPDDSECLPWPR